MMYFLGRCIAWPLKALAWLLLIMAMTISGLPRDSLSIWVKREFLGKDW